MCPEQVSSHTFLFIIIFMCICAHILDDFHSVNLILDKE